MSKLQRQARRITAVAGGKGGVGKSIVAISLACHWASQGRRVTLVDLDLGAGNLHTYLGQRTPPPSIAGFLHRQTDSLAELIVPTTQPKLWLCSGADDQPGTANPPHWMKQKLLRHIQAIDADDVVLDLGAGTAFNTLDFFLAADVGVVVTEPEPPAVMNAYGFVKAALYRALHQVFRHHPALAAHVQDDLARPEDQRVFGVDWLRQIATVHAPDAVDLIDEITAAFQPKLVVNRHHSDANTRLIDNLGELCRQRLGVGLARAGSLPDAPTLRRHLLDVPGFLRQPSPYVAALPAVADNIAPAASVNTPPAHAQAELDADEQQALIDLIDRLPPEQLDGRSAQAWKLRVYFRPDDVIALLQRQDVDVAGHLATRAA